MNFPNQDRMKKSHITISLEKAFSPQHVLFVRFVFNSCLFLVDRIKEYEKFT